MISTGGSKVAPPGCRVQANGGAAPSGMGMGTLSAKTWFRATTAGSAGVGTLPSARVMDPALTIIRSPSMPSTVSSTSSVLSNTLALLGFKGGSSTGVDSEFSALGMMIGSK